MILINKEDNNIIQPNKNQIKKMARALSQAFQKGPMYEHLLPDNQEREKNLHLIFKVFIKYYLKYGVVYVTSEHLEGIILSSESTCGNMSMLRLLRCGGWKLPLKFGFDFLKRVDVIDEVNDSKREILAPKPYEYLSIIGVLPSEQGKGYGGKLLNFYLKELDRKKLPCYLETAKKDNLTLYEHFGFKIIDDYEFPDKNLTIWFLLRSI